MRTTATLLLVTALAAGACSGPDGRATAGLADRAEHIATSIRAGRDCEAIRLTRGLRAAAAHGHRQGTVSQAVAEQVTATTGVLLDELSCRTAAPTPTEPGDDRQGGQDDEKDEEDREEGDDEEKDEKAEKDKENKKDKDDGTGNDGVPGRGRARGRG